MDKERFLAFYEEAGYRVVDSFAYSDIKLFLMRNRPKITYRVLYGVIMLFILLGIGLMIGGSLAQSFGGFEYAYLFGACLTVVSTLFFIFKAGPHFNREKLR